MRFLLISLASFFLAFSPSLFSAIQPGELRAGLDAIFADWDSTVTPGCSLAVSRNGEVVYQRGYGMADLDHDVPVRPSTVFHVASVSKQFTAAAVLLLAQEGKLSLDDPVQKYVAEMPRFQHEITIRQLIHHISGLRDQWALLDLAGWRYSLDLITDDDVLYLLKRQQDLNFTPGEKYLYCNTGYTLMAQIVKNVSGKSFREFTSARIFAPLGMRDTHFRDDHAEVIKNQAYGYEPGKETGFRLSVTNFDTVGATSLLTTARDLTLWADNFSEPRVGGQDLVDRMLERGILNSGEKIPYASGVSVNQYRGLRTVSHGGSDAGYRAHFLTFPDQRVAITCLCNLSTVSPGVLAYRVADLVLQDALEKEADSTAKEEIELNAEQLEGLAGVYWNAEDKVSVKFSTQSGKLSLMYSPYWVAEMKAVGPRDFEVPNLGETVEFQNPSMGAPLALIKTSSDKPPRVFEKVDSVDPAEVALEEYVGMYHSEELNLAYEFKLADGKLMLNRLKRKPEELEPMDRDRFLGDTGVFRFDRDEKGTLTGVELNSPRIKNFRLSRVGE